MKRIDDTDSPAGPAFAPASFAREEDCRRRGLWPVAGVDEVGRGPLAGPVVAAAVVLDPDRIPEGLTDSKKLTPARREALYAFILESAAVSVASVPASVIDRINIRQATLAAMARALRGLPVRPLHAFVDGRDCPPDAPCPTEAVVKGDLTVASIAAASIVAKVIRDRAMTRLATRYEGFGWHRNAGYGTPEHIEAIVRTGPTRHHRLSFAPVAQGRFPF